MTPAAVEHVLRTPLPWRPDDARTECGRPASEFASVLTREQVIKKFRDLGKTRAIMTTCVTCAQTADRHPTWETNPAAVLTRYVEDYGSPWRVRDEAARRRFSDELRAIALLIGAHRGEFDELVGGLGETVDLRRVRQDRARRAGR